MDKEKIENLEGEIWIENNGYEISNKGRIISKRGRLSRCKVNQHGYINCNVKFEDGFHAKNVHRAVAYAFLGKPPEGKVEVNHIDGNKQNNCIENLEWVTKQENQYHASYVLGKRLGEDCTRSILKEEQVIEIYNLCKSRTMYYKEIAELYGVFPQEVSDIALGVYWKGLKLKPLPKITRWDIMRNKDKLKELHKSESEQAS